MRILAVDDERLALESLMASIRKVAPEEEVVGFRYAEDALEQAARETFDVAFLDIKMMGHTGVAVAEQLKIINPRINIIFATGYGSYRDAAFDMHASGYLVKPITPEKVKKELDNLRYPVSAAPRKRIRVRAFGNFEVMCDGKPVAFKYSKSKELLAYLVDRKGAMCSVGECMTVLFEDDDGHETYFKSLRRDLLDVFDALGCGDVIARERGKLGVIIDAVECDYYNYLRGHREGVNDYAGEYMSQYSWAELTYANLEAKKGES